MKKIYWWEKKRTWKRVEAEKEGGAEKGRKREEEAGLEHVGKKEERKRERKNGFG